MQFQALSLVLLFISTTGIPRCLAQNYALQSSQSKVDFTIKNLGIPVDGHFTDVTGELRLNAVTKQPEFMYGEIPVSTIETGISMRDRHLLKADYFDAGRYPRLKFKSESILPGSKGYTIKGWISIKGKSQPIQMSAELIKTGKGYLVKSSFVVKRSSFNLGNSSLLSDEVRVDWNLVFGP